MKRESGVLMHVSSLFGNYSSGSFGEEARYFIDFLCEAGFSVWQVLPFCMPDEYGSPYKSYSAFGANPYFIDLPTLYEAGLLTAEELNAARQSTPYLCEHSVAYTGTHDNNTLLGYVWEMTPECRRAVFDYCGNLGGDFAEGVRCIVRTVMMSASSLAVFPIQDILGFGSDTRMNTPGVAKGNWCYRITKEQLDSIDRSELLKYNRLYGRKA